MLRVAKHRQSRVYLSVRCLVQTCRHAGEPRIKAEAAALGIDPGRIIFTDVAAKPIHIRRSGLADVFLDTPLCNAHTTGAAGARGLAPCGLVGWKQGGGGELAGGGC